MYARLCAEEPLIDTAKYSFLYAVVYPDSTWSFPASLSDEDLKVASRLPKGKGVAHVAEIDPSVVVPHMFCYEGMTSFRALFDVLKVPYVGCSAENMALATDKAQTKAVLSSAGVNVPRGTHVKQGELPALLKAVRLLLFGSSFYIPPPPPATYSAPPPSSTLSDAQPNIR